MNDKFGSMKSMLKRWKINLKKKKKKQKEELDEKKKKRKSRIISFLYNVIAILIIPFGYFFEKNNTKKEINKLNVKIDTSNSKELIKTITEVEQIKKKAIALKNEKIIKQVKILEDKCNQRKKEILEESKKTKDLNKKEKFTLKKDGLSAKNHIMSGIGKTNLSNNIIESTKEKSKVSLNLVGGKENFNPNKPKIIKEHKKNDFANLKNGVVSIVISPKLLFNKQKLSFKEKLTDIDLSLNKMSIDLTKLTKYNQFYSYENDLNIIEKELNELLNKNKSFLLKVKDESLYDYNKLNESIEEIKSKICNNRDFIINSKANLLKKQEQQVKIKIDEKQNEKKQKEDKQKTIDEEKYILENLLKQQEFLLSHFDMLQNSNNKKFVIKNNIINFLNDFMPKSLFPLMFIKNKFLSSILVSIIFNNSLKTMRKMVDPTIKFEYLKLNEKFNGIKNVYEDSYRQIQNLKNELIALNILDIQILSQLEQMEKICLDNIQQIDLKNKAIQKVLIKNFKN